MPKPPHVCFDRLLPRDEFKFQRTMRLRRGGPVRAISPIGKLWMNGSTLRVRFMGGSAAQQAIVKEQANWWTAHANLRFEFGSAPGGPAKAWMTADSKAPPITNA
jgi:hypothetical protein